MSKLEEQETYYLSVLWTGREFMNKQDRKDCNM